MARQAKRVTAAPDVQTAPSGEKNVNPTPAQRRYLRRGLTEPGGKLPLFEDDGRGISPRTVRACIERGWAEPWFSNPLKPDWLVCRLTELGRQAVSGATAQKPASRKNDGPKGSSETAIDAT